MIVSAHAGVPSENGDYRDFGLDWTIDVTDVPEGVERVNVWIAVPQALPEQIVSDLDVRTDHDWRFVHDREFGNRLVRVTVDDPAELLSIGLVASVRRYPVTEPRAAPLSRIDHDLYLREEALVSLSPRIRALADSVGGDDRARYDYVLDLMEYDKSTPGWGRGDSERACDVAKGNCTDFHSLFMSLSRAKSVPTFFEMGYPTTPDGESDRVGGYHCWAWFYGEGSWSPVDISEADKAPEKRDFYFGNLDPDRITFSRGRDITLPGMRGAPLNYIPSGAYAEVDGRPWDGVTRRLTYTVNRPG